MSPDASGFGESDDGTAGFAPAVEEGPRKDANFLVALDADSATAGAEDRDASAGSCGWPAGAEGANVNGVVAPLVAPKPEK